MSKLTGSVNPGVKDGNRTETVIVTTTRITPPGVPSTSTYSNQTYGSHNRSPLLISRRRPRVSLPYRVFAGVFQPHYFDYTYGTGTVYNRTGKTPVSASIGAGVSLQWGTKLSGGLIVPDVSQNMINRATTEALNNLNSNKSNVLAVLAEAKQSINLIADIVSRIIRSILLIRKGKWGQAARVVSGAKVRGRDTRASRAWLTYQYALRPAMYDIMGIVDALQQSIPKNPLVSGRRYISSSYGLPTQPAHYKLWQIEGKCEVGAEVCIYASINNLDTYFLNQLALFNPFLLGWELTTLSFVIDWLIPIGNTLEALTADIGLSFRDGFINTKTVSNFSFAGVNTDPPVKGKLPGGRILNVCQNRQALLDFPMPGIYIKSPFSTNNVINALALFAVLRK